MATRIDVLTRELHEIIDLIVCNHVRSEGVAVQIAALSFALRNIKNRLRVSKSGYFKLFWSFIFFWQCEKGKCNGYNLATFFYWFVSISTIRFFNNFLLRWFQNFIIELFKFLVKRFISF